MLSVPLSYYYCLHDACCYYYDFPRVVWTHRRQALKLEKSYGWIATIAKLSLCAVDRKKKRFKHKAIRSNNSRLCISNCCRNSASLAGKLPPQTTSRPIKADLHPKRGDTFVTAS